MIFSKPKNFQFLQSVWDFRSLGLWPMFSACSSVCQRPFYEMVPHHLTIFLAWSHCRDTTLTPRWSRVKVAFLATLTYNSLVHPCFYPPLMSLSPWTATGPPGLRFYPWYFKSSSGFYLFSLLNFTLLTSASVLARLDLTLYLEYSPPFEERWGNVTKFSNINYYFSRWQNSLIREFKI